MLVWRKKAAVLQAVRKKEGNGNNLCGPDFANHSTPDVEAHEEETDGLSCSSEISIGPYTVVIFSQDE